MENKLTIFNNNEFGEIRTLLINGEPWFIGRDVAESLGYANTSKAIKDHVDKEDKAVTKCYTPGGEQEMTVINESGLYSLIFSSQLPNAKKFKKWVTSEVLPQIRKTGSYTLAKVQYTVTPKEELECLNVVSGILNFNDNSKLIGVRSIYDKYGMETSYLPAYTPSKGVLKSATELLKEHNSELSVIKFNKKLVELGILKECTRQSTKDKNKVKKFKNLVDTTWGENETSPRNPKETQPLYYEDKFKELLEIVQA